MFRNSNTQMIAVAIVIASGLWNVDTANAAGLYWKIVNSSGRILGQVSSSRVSDVPMIESELQGRYPGIKLSIKHCKQPTLLEAMNPVFGRYWQCGTIIYRGHVIPRRTRPTQVVMFAPSNSGWRYVGADGNSIMFMNTPKLSKGNIFVWTEDYSAFALADAISARTGTTIYAIGLENGASKPVKKVAEQIVNSYPSQIGGSTYRTSIHVQRDLWEIDCASGRMRNVQTIDARGRLMDIDAGPWFRPRLPDGRMQLMQRECSR